MEVMEVMVDIMVVVEADMAVMEAVVEVGDTVK